jgi:hypothetical protein
VKTRTSRSWFGWIVVIVLLGAVGAGVYAAVRSPGDPRACEALARARIARLLAAPGISLSCPGVETAPLEASHVLDAEDPSALITLVTAEKGSAVAVVPGAGARGIGRSLGKFAHIAGLRGVVFSPRIAVYAPFRESALGEKEREALPHVARALLRGAREPSMSSFPPSLRRVERVEVMVSLLQNGQPRLWRSARGTNIARALLTAARVARDRWQERETAMGGPLRERLGELDVQVSLLSEDGTLASTGRTLVDAVTTSAHGLGFDHRSNWHYLLPADVQKRGKGSPYRALSELVREQSLLPGVLDEPNTRVYRFVVLPLGTSRAAAVASGGRSD